MALFFFYLFHTDWYVELICDDTSADIATIYNLLLLYNL